MRVPIPGKSAWPELVGKLAQQAAFTILQERPDVAVEILPTGSPVPDSSALRVRVYMNKNGLVSKIPVIGG